MGNKETDEEDVGESIEARYANDFRVGFNRDEIVVDIGQAFGNDAAFYWRIICGPPYARAFSAVLQKSLNQYEDQYGAIPEPEGR